MKHLTVALQKVAIQTDSDWWLEWIDLIGPVLGALLFAFVIAAFVIVFFIPMLERADWIASGDEQDAIEILRELYARGEIDEEEFERRESFLRNRER
ncbi:SHOCT domain-containing protein [Halalkalicoccus sp. NIPERK01]|uniref:SHOCT domain-containing protein n=1 Tax=Halalkalicoccus sp. NIPERK01 TaxID=3053469 RepID=UPI00256F4E85|nr:SHOCT domain-containing protein [Halalkalicoccus sp. NIPERK01]MDL5361683.1 SHOCT domain-containing protein [Halalkalicoccus sp. NIPERK01]